MRCVEVRQAWTIGLFSLLHVTSEMAHPAVSHCGTILSVVNHLR